MIIGVDLGGTNVRGAIVSEDGSLTNRKEHPSHAREGADACWEAVRRLVDEVAVGRLPDAVGIAIPGHIDAVNGIVLWAPNFGEVVEGKLRIWEDVDAFGPLKGVSRSRVAIGNDANLAALGEYRHGVGKGSVDGLVLFTLGTGVGTGAVISPRGAPGLPGPTVYIGHRGGAAEMGHVKIVTDGRPCGCESRGCLEAYCGTPGLLQTARENGFDATDPRALFEAAEAGDARALASWEAFGGHLGIAVANTINTWAPEVVAIGGQIAGAWKYFAPSMERVARGQSIESLSRGTRIVQAEKREDAGILGAAELARQSL